MNTWLQLFVLLVFAGVLGAGYRLLSAAPKLRVLPPPTTKKPEPPYHETNSLAKLFVEAVGLKERAAKWPAILRSLNPDDEPHIRTLLLELRSHRAADPNSVLEAIERTCIAAKRGGQSPSRCELLERALTVLREATPSE